MATSSVNFLTSLGAGSGIDTKSLAQSLVDAERAPRKNLIDQKIAKEEKRITGQGAIKSLLTSLQGALGKLKDSSDFNSITPSISQPGALGVTASSNAQSGSYDITITQIAKATRLASEPLASASTALNVANNGAAFDLSVNGQNVSVSITTPSGIVSAVNAATNSTGVSAQLIKTGSGYSVVFTGKTGAANDFTVTGLPAEMTLRNAALQTAQDAEFTVNGLPITSSTNQVSEAIAGVTIDLYAPTTGGTSARLDLNRQTNVIKDNITALVNAYNDLEAGLKELGDSKSVLEEFGGTMTGDSLLQTVRSQIRAMLVKDAKATSTASDGTTTVSNPDVYAMRHVGLSFDRNGKLTLDSARLDAALSAKFDQVVTLFTADKNDQSVYATSSGGLAGEAYKDIDKMLRSTGIIARQSVSAQAKIVQYQKELTALEDRMNLLLKRYTDQFSAMDSIVGESNATKTGLTNSFKGLMAMYTNG